MSSSVYFRFKSQKEPSRVVFDGTGISVFELKREIIALNHLGDGTDFELLISSDQTNEEFNDDTSIIPRSTTVIAKRLPALKPGRGGAARYVTGKMPHNSKISNRADASVMTVNPQGKFAEKVITLPEMSNPQTEEQKIAAMFKMGAEQWAEQQQEMSHATPVHRLNNTKKTNNVPDRPLPPGYICYRCGEKGHWIQACPTNDDPSFDGRPRVKRTTGIPRSFLKTIERPTALTNDSAWEESKQPSGVMVNAEGDWVIAEPDQASWDNYQAKAKASAAAREAAALGSKELQQRGLECSIDKRLFVEPTKTPCCQTTYCLECITNALLENDLCCPNCSADNILIDNLEQDNEMGFKVRNYEKEQAGNLSPDVSSNAKPETYMSISEQKPNHPSSPGSPNEPSPKLEQKQNSPTLKSVSKDALTQVGKKSSSFSHSSLDKLATKPHKKTQSLLSKDFSKEVLPGTERTPNSSSQNAAKEFSTEPEKKPNFSPSTDPTKALSAILERSPGSMLVKGSSQDLLSQSRKPLSIPSFKNSAQDLSAKSVMKLNSPSSKISSQDSSTESEKKPGSPSFSEFHKVSSPGSDKDPKFLKSNDSLDPASSNAPSTAKKRTAESELKSNRTQKVPSRLDSKRQSILPSQHQTHQQLGSFPGRYQSQQLFADTNYTMAPEIDMMPFSNTNYGVFPLTAISPAVSANPSMLNAMFMQGSPYMTGGNNGWTNLWGSGVSQQPNIHTGFLAGQGAANGAYTQQHYYGSMNNQFQDARSNNQGLGAFSNQQQIAFSAQASNEEDCAYFRKPVNPHRHQARRNLNRPTDYREI